MIYTAGRELDALIAEKVMGWTPLVGVSAIASFEGNPELTDPARWHRQKIWVKDGVKVGCEECGTMPNYSTSIADAWQVVDKFRRGGGNHAAACVTCHISDAIGEPDCSCTISGPSIAEVTATAGEMPLAICLAALKVKQP